jgi:hypothetical protein
MKKVYHLLNMFVLVAGIAVPSIYAQSDRMAVAKVPFNFVVDGSTLAPGDYQIKTLSFSGEVSIRNTDGSAALLFLTFGADANRADQTAKLVFHRYGDQYFLAQVWFGAETIGRELPKSKVERGVERNEKKAGEVSVLLAAPSIQGD